MEKWTVRKIARGLRLIDKKGFTYCKDRHIGNRSYWRCDHRPFKCKARALISGNLLDPKKGQIVSNYIEHEHDPPTDVYFTDEKQLPSNSPSPSPSTSSMKSILKPPSAPPKTAKPVAAKPVKSTSSTSSVGEPEAEVCLRWNSHHSNMQTCFPNLMDKEQYVDVTLAADGHVIKCHKLILSSCSSYFDDMLKTVNSFQHPIIFLQQMEFWQVKSLVEFMYKGEVNVDQSKLESLLQAAELLQIKGLAGKSTVKKEIEEPVVPETYLDETVDEYLRPDSPNYVGNPGDEEEFKPYYYYKKKLKKTRKRNIPEPGQLKTVPCNLKGTKTRPIIKQPVFYDPDFPDHDPYRSVSPPTIEKDTIFHIDNVKLEPIDIELPDSPLYYPKNNSKNEEMLDTENNKKMPLIVELRSGKDEDFDEPPTKKSSMSIEVIKNKEKAPIIIEKIIQKSEVPITIEKIGNQSNKIKNADIKLNVEKIKTENEENESETSENNPVQKKYCIRVVKMNQLNGKSESDASENISNTSNIKIKNSDSNNDPPPLLTVKKFASTDFKSNSNLNLNKSDSSPIIKINIPKDTNLPSTSRASPVSDLGFKKIKLTTTESVLQKIAKSQLTSALDLQDNVQSNDGLSILKKTIIVGKGLVKLSTEEKGGKIDEKDCDKDAKNEEI